MKKTTAVILFLSIGGLFIFGWVAGRITHAIDYYTFATESNMPTHATGELFFASNLKKPDYGNFVCFKNLATNNYTYIYRVIGKANDMIEIKNAVVYRNGTALNEPNTWNEYRLTQKQYFGIVGFIKKNKNTMLQLNDSTYNVSLTDAEVKQYGIKAPKVVYPKSQNDEIWPDFKNRGYNADNFGPIKVPAASYFVMGDNRHNALDSRYRGFIKAGDIIGTKLGN